MAFLFLTTHRLLARTRSAAYNTQQGAANKNIAQWSQKGGRKRMGRRARNCERERECASESKDVHWNLTLRMSVVFLIKINKVYSGFYVRRLWRRLLCSLLALDLNNHPHPPPHPHFG